MLPQIKFRAVTANCGNDTIGETASAAIARQLNKEQLDLMVINCQEVSFKKAKQQLEKALGPNSGYTVTLLGKMSTHTKPFEQLHRNTGLATFVIHKNDFHVHVTERVKARRDVSRFSGSGFNKGGLVIDFTVTDSNQQNIRLQTISGHLDSKNTSQRTQDWANIHLAIGKDKVNHWEELVQAMPNIRLAGYDANTRNKYIDEHNAPVKIWEESGIVPQELKAFKQAPLGGEHFSVDSTYKTSKDDITTTQDPKRPGYVRGGMLDFVDIASDVKKEPSSMIMTDNVISIGSESNTKRDHDVIISPIQTYVQGDFSEFDRVKQQMITQLHVCAPALAERINKFTMKDKKELCEIYNTYLSKEGLLFKQLELQADLLGNLNKIKKISRSIGDRIDALLLTDKAWFSVSAKETKTKQAFESVISDALSACRTKSDLNEVYNVLHDPSQSTVFLKEKFEGIIEQSNASLLPEVHSRCMKQVDELLKKINSPSEALSPEIKAGLIIQAALEFTGELYKELKLLKKSNAPGKEAARSVLLGMLKLVKVVTLNLINLFQKEHPHTDKQTQSKQVDKIARNISLNLSTWLDRLGLSLKSTMASRDFKTMVESQKNQAEQSTDKSVLLKR